MRLYWLLAPMAVMVGACENNSATVAPRWTDEAIPATAPVPPVWFREDQVALGKTVYLDHCAECHGQLAEGDPNWRRQRPDGYYPPPPLNGSGHAWHHSLSDLSEVIMNGRPGGEKPMPAWRDRLSEQEVTAVIAWFQSIWSEQVYTAWYGMHRAKG